jgi:hypothetical protein
VANYDPHDAEQVKEAYSQLMNLRIMSPTRVNWTGNLSTCAPGDISVEARAATIDAINFYRIMAGVSPVTLNTTYANWAQQGAIIWPAALGPNGELPEWNPHEPPADARCYTTQGADASLHSNLALGLENPVEATIGLIDDLGIGNEMVGHRRSLLFPTQNSFAIGYGGLGTALMWGMYDAGVTGGHIVFGEWGDAYGQGTVVRWPAPGVVFPFELFPTSGRWSYSAARLPVTSSTTVTVTRITSDGIRRVMQTGPGVNDIKIVSRSAGPPEGDRSAPDQGYLVWEMPALPKPADGTQDTYEVVINDMGPSPITYTINAFSATDSTQPSAGAAVVSFNTSTPSVGSTVTATATGYLPTDGSVTFTWYRGSVHPSNAISVSGATYTAVLEDFGKKLCVEATVSAAGYTPAKSTACTANVTNSYVKPATPSISGTPRVGATLTAGVNPAAWVPNTGVTFTYEWRRGATIVGTDAAYTVTPADLGAQLTVYVRGEATGYIGADASALSAQVQAGALNAPDPTIAGSFAEGETLTANPGSWSPGGVTLSYQWLRNGTAISGATDATYVVTTDDAGAEISVRVTGELTGYTTESKTSEATAVEGPPMEAGTPTITGTPEVGSVLTADPGVWIPPNATFTFQWYRDGFPIPGATDSTYTLTEEDAGHEITVIVTGTATGWAVTASFASAAVVAPRLNMNPAVTIEGVAQVGKTLRANVGAWIPGDATFYYQWFADSAAVGGDSPQYRPTAADIGKRIRVVVTASRTGYNPAEAAPAAPTGPVVSAAGVPGPPGGPAEPPAAPVDSGGSPYKPGDTTTTQRTNWGPGARLSATGASITTPAMTAALALVLGLAFVARSARARKRQAS